jgi:alkanesulfonate monooxygenase SsuD/methylene tetrahydromethanopterin reductase-like flavin-dependent oxidoreductase (luciferase family)
MFYLAAGGRSASAPATNPEETVQACLRMLVGERGDKRAFEGKHVRLERALNVPQSLSRPHPPIMIAGSGERRTLPLVAKYADACNIRPGPEIPRQLDLLKRLCDEEQHDYAAIERTAPFAFDIGETGPKKAEGDNCDDCCSYLPTKASR